jgi:hypothetical protein
MTTQDKPKIKKTISQRVKDFLIDKEYNEQRKLISESFSQNNFDDDYIKNLIHPPLENNSVLLGKDVIEDIELFKTYRDDNFDDNYKSISVFDSINKTNLKGSSIYLKNILANPELSKTILTKRQNILFQLQDKPINTILENMATQEDDVLWLFEDKEENVKALYDIVYFRSWLLKNLNNVDYAVTSYNIYRIILSPVIGIMSPIVYFIVPFLVLKYKYKIKLSFKAYLSILFDSSKLMFSMSGWSSNLRYCSYIFSLIFYFQGVFNSIEISKTLYNVTDVINKKMISIIKFIDNGNELLDKYYNNEIPYMFFSMHTIPPYTNLNLKLNGDRWWITTNFGKILKYFKQIDKEQIKNLLTQTYMLDSLNSIISLRNNGYTFTNYSIDTKLPYMQVEGLGHPCLKSNTIKNNINLGEKETYNMILTGPNAGGKSTLVKSILINTLLSQTITMSCSNKCTITPFKYINSQINIPDCKGKESLFQAEMNRCKYNFDVIQSLDNTDYSLIIMDEVFNSTNPIEGISGAYAVADHLSKHTNVMVIFTTHFVYLTKLQKNTKRFTNYRMNVKRKDNQIIFPYKLKKGISQQYIALELLEQNGFNDELITEAKKIRDKLSV